MYQVEMKNQTHLCVLLRNVSEVCIRSDFYSVHSSMCFVFGCVCSLSNIFLTTVVHR